MKKKKVVILFSKLSDYMLNVFNQWSDESNIELHIFKDDIDQIEAPFVLNEQIENIHFYRKHDYPKNLLLQKLISVNPQMIICAGWNDLRYLYVTNFFHRNIPTVLTMDNQWKGTLKQHLGMIVSRLFLTKKFSNIWVPGAPQVNYAIKLGFKKSQIFTGFYVANEKNFSKDIINPENKFKKRFIFTGRYIEIKGLLNLWKAFVEFQNETQSEWELICIGTGPLYENRIIHPRITHTGFLQPHQLKNYLGECGVFVLPSHHEPWGLVVHEFALGGFPMIVSDTVGAASALVNDQNGVIFKNGDKDSLKNALKKMSTLSLTDLQEMSHESFTNAQKITVDNWINTANYFLDSKTT